MQGPLIEQYVDAAEDNFRLPKNIFVVALENLSYQYTPPRYMGQVNRRAPDEKVIKNLRKF